MKMSGKLATTVFVQAPDGEHVMLSPGDDLPGWAASVIDNPKAWEGGEHPGLPEAAADPHKGDAEKADESDEADKAPRKNGALADWQEYAKSKGASDEDLADKSRDELVEKYGA